MSKTILVFGAIIAVVLSSPEKPAPYPAKGWKPQGARLELPGEYGTPRADLNDIEITTVTNEYLPPTTTEIQSDENDDILRVQGLPAVESVSQFRKFQKRRPANIKARPQVARFQITPAPAFANQPLLLSPLFAPQFAAVKERLQEKRFGNLEASPEVNDPKNDVQQLPARAYGPPQTNDEPAPKKENDEPNLPENEEVEQPQNDSEEDEDEDDEDESGEPTIAVSNAESNGNLVQGQYYLLLPDQSLQKVRFATKQTDEDREINGFSAQLRYSPVEAIKDPVFGFDEQGKLVRLYK